MIEDIITKNLLRIENDLKEIDDIVRIDFADIFPTSEKHKQELDNEMNKIEWFLENQG